MTEENAREMLKHAVSPVMAGYLTRLIPGAVKKQLKPTTRIRIWIAEALARRDFAKKKRAAGEAIKSLRRVFE